MTSQQSPTQKRQQIWAGEIQPTFCIISTQWVVCQLLGGRKYSNLTKMVYAVQVYSAMMLNEACNICVSRRLHLIYDHRKTNAIVTC